MSFEFIADFYNCPSFFITDAVSEVSGVNVCTYHWHRRGSVLVPQFIAIVPAGELAAITRTVGDAARKSLASGWGDLVGVPHH